MNDTGPSGSAAVQDPNFRTSADSPYVEWVTLAEGSKASIRERFELRDFPPARIFQDAYQRWLDPEKSRSKTARKKPNNQAKDVIEGLIDSTYIGAAWLPRETINDDWLKVGDWAQPSLFDNLKDDPTITDKTTIVGVIDSGAGLAHQRLMADYGSRVIASWQQSARFDEQLLPFGHEVYKWDIDAALQNNTTSSWLDEDAFNRDLRLAEHDRTDGARDLLRHAAHGTHVLDLATGYDPHDADQDILERIRIIVVNMPPQYYHAPSGAFLQLFAMYGVARVIDLADSLWKAKFPKDPDGGFNIAINMSYGMRAGPKNGSMAIERGLRALIRSRGDRSPIRMCLPAGNNNLERSTARLKLKRRKPQTVDWRIMPDDHTSNFVEIWQSEVAVADNDEEAQVRLKITPPGMDTWEVPNIREGNYTDLPAPGSGKALARVYKLRRNFKQDNKADYTQQHFVLCVAPTAAHEEMKADLAPAGDWTLEVRSTNRDTDLDLHIQSDQSFEITSMAAKQSHFVDKRYERFLPSGHVRDSFAYHEWEGMNGEDLEKGSTSCITRQATHNAIGSTSYAILVGGYTKSDGRPAYYSATGRREPTDESPGDIDVLLPSEDAPTYYGLQASGAKDGSVVTFRGASTASALATRLIAEVMAEGISGEEYGPNWIGRLASAFEGKFGNQSVVRPPHWLDVTPLKSGQGRLDAPDSFRRGRVARK